MTNHDSASQDSVAEVRNPQADRKAPGELALLPSVECRCGRRLYLDPTSPNEYAGHLRGTPIFDAIAAEAWDNGWTARDCGVSGNPYRKRSNEHNEAPPA